MFVFGVDDGPDVGIEVVGPFDFAGLLIANVAENLIDLRVGQVGYGVREAFEMLTERRIFGRLRLLVVQVAFSLLKAPLGRRQVSTFIV